MVLPNHVYGPNAIFVAMSVPLVNNPWMKWLRVIKRGSYQAAAEYSRWSYEPVSGLCTGVDPVSDSSDDGSSDEGSKDQDNPDYQEQVEEVSVPRMNPRRIIQGDQRALIQLKS